MEGGEGWTYLQFRRFGSKIDMDKLGNDVFVQKIGTLIEDAINTVFKCRGDGN